MAIGLETLFTFLVALVTVCLLAYSLYNRKRWAIPLLLIAGAAYFFINYGYWYLSVAFVPFLFFPLSKRVGYEGLALFSMIPAIALAHFMLMFFSTYTVPGLIWIAILAVTLVCALGILGTFENDLKRFMVYSNLLQLSFVLLDLSVASITGKLGVLGTVQIFNYTFAGMLLFISLGVLSRNLHHRTISGMEGRFYSEKVSATVAVIAGLSLVGLPGLNIFVAEYFLFVAAFAINPMITVMGIFAALILFIMYFKIPFTLLVSREKAHIKSPLLLDGIGLALAVAVIVLGMLPQLQLFILTGGI